MKLLLLAGTGEARQIAAALAGRDDLSVVASLAGATRTPAALPVETRTGGFGGDAGFAAWLDHHRPDAILDATHPFAAQVSTRTAQISQTRGLPYLQLLRLQWTPVDGDTWTEVADETDVANIIPEGKTVFLATGRQTLPRFADLAINRRLLCRQIDPPKAPFPFPDGGWIIGRPPFSTAQEVALFQDLAIDWLVVKNAGGAASATKLHASRELGIPVAMIARPPQPDAPRVATVAEALAWVDSLL